MIEELRIRNLGVINEAVLTLSSGFTVITGETGAGKTMLLTGLSLVMGQKGDPARVRTGSDRAEVEALVTVPPELIERLDELDVALDDDALIIGRTLAREGRGRAILGGRSVPSATLVEIAPYIIEVHGQGQQQRLARADVQREVLDRYGAEVIAEPLERYQELYGQMRETVEALREVVENTSERAAEAGTLQALLEQFDALAPLPGELGELGDEAQRLANSEGLGSAASIAHEALSADDGDCDVLTKLALARRALDHEREHDRALAELSDRLAEASAVVADVAGDLAAYRASLDSDPARLDFVEQRRANLTAFTRRHEVDLDELIEQAPALRQRLLDLSDGDEAEQRLRSQLDVLRKALVPVALELHQARVATAESLSTQVREELTALAMPSATVAWQVELSEVATNRPGLELPDGRRVGLSAHGADEVSLLMSSHPQAPLAPLAKAASGGELSRVMLAIEVVLAGSDPVGTMVFDEIDAGVGGRAAVEIGRRLAALAQNTQVLVVTHLPQVAAIADQHLQVAKAETAGVTATEVNELKGEDRVRELARMLAGLDESQSAAEHARELLELAKRDS